MVRLCRVEDLPSSTATFSKIQGNLEGNQDSGVGQRHISVVNGEEATSAVTVTANETETEEFWSRESCKTPTAKEFRIPEILICPPAPRKRRDPSFSRLSSSSSSGLAKEYFIPPNLEAMFALDKSSTTVK